MARRRRVLVVGETLIDFVPTTMAPLETVDRFHRRAGGAPANVAVGLAKLDTPSWFWTRLGDDHFGTYLSRTLESYDVPLRFVERDESARTTLAFVGAGPADEPSFSFYRENTADTRFSAGSIPESVLETVAYVYFGGIVLASDPSRSAIFSLLRRAREHGCRIVFDPNTRPELWADAELQSVIERAVSLSDIVTASVTDLTTIGWAGTDRELLDRVLAAGPHTAFLTNGADGAVVIAREQAPWGAHHHEHDGFDVDVVDPTGAGDAFTAAILAELTNSDPVLSRALRLANAVGAHTTTSTGGMAAIPTLEDVRAAYPSVVDRR